MSQERLVLFQQLQVSANQLHTYAKSKSFEENIVGFYVRLKDDSPSSSSPVGVIEGIRLGRAYSIPDIKYCTKHLLVHQPPHPKRTFRLTEVSDDPFTLADLEQWEANMAILRMPLNYKFDLSEATRRRRDMSPPEATQTSPAAPDDKKLHSASEPRSLSKQPQSEEKAPSPLSHIAMFEERARGAAEEEQQRLEKRKSSSQLSRFLPPRAQKAPEVVKASETGATRRELASPKSSASKVSLLARTFESSSPREGEPLSPSDRTSRRATVIGLPALSLSGHTSPSVAREKVSSPSTSSESSTPTPSPSTATRPSSSSGATGSEEKAAPVQAPPTQEDDEVSKQEEESDATESRTEEPEPSPSRASQILGKSQKDKQQSDNASSAEQTPTSSTPTTPETERHLRKSARGKKRKPRVSSTDDVTPRRTSSDTPDREKRRKHSVTGNRPGSINLDLDLDLPSPKEGARSNLSSPDVAIRSPNSKKKRNKRNSKKRPSRRLKAISVEASAEAADVLGSMRAVDSGDDDSFLQDSARTPPLELGSVGEVNVRSSADDINKDRSTDPSPRYPHRRHVSCEDVSKENLTRDILPSPRSVNLDMHHVLSRIIIPMSSLDGDWESKKIRHFEKQARQHAKEKDLLELENEGVTTRMKSDTDSVIAALEVKHAQERKATDRKIQTDQNTLNELISQEKKQLTRTLAREKEQADEKLTEEHAREEKRQAEDFEKQMAQIRKVGVPGAEGENALLAHLRRAHDTEKKRQTRKKDLNQLLSVHRHEQAKVKRIQEQQRKHVEMQQAQARETLILQLSLSQRQMRQKRWSLLDDIQSRENTSRSMQEKRQQMELRHEAAAQELALKLLRKQQGMERESVTKSQQSQQKQSNAAIQKQKKALKASLAATTKKLQRDKTLAKEDVKERVEKMKSELDHNLSHVEENVIKALPDMQSQISVLEARHEQQMRDFEKERTRRRDVLLLYHQQQKNDLQTRLEEERRQMECTMKENMDAFQQEEITMKEAFTEAHDTCLWDIQQRHWQESYKMQTMHHEEQQEFMKAAAVQAKVDPFQRPSPRPVSEDSDAHDEASEVERQKEEEERLRQEEEARREAEEEEALQRELQRQLEEQQEAEKRQLEQEREAEQERLRAQLEEEKKEVMQTTIKEDESTLRAEYIRKIALETGLSEELIAAQIDRIGIPSFMF